MRLYRQGDGTLAARRELLLGVRERLLEQRAQLDAAIDRLAYKIDRYDIAVKTGVLSWNKEEEDPE